MYLRPEKVEPFIDKQIDETILAKIDDSDKKMLNYLGRLYKALGAETIDFNTVQTAIEGLQQFNSASEYTYLNNLLHPEKEKGVKIPSPIPVPSSAFQLHNTVTLSTNSSGNLAFVFNPFYLYDNTGLSSPISNGYVCNPLYSSSFWVNNSDTLTGQAYDDNFKPVNISQGIPPVYDQYRLVSASVVVRYIGRLDWVSGVIGGAIVYDDTRYVGEAYKVDNQDPVSYSKCLLAKYGNFDLALDSFYHQENLCVEGLRQLYFPVDNSFEDYTKIWSSFLSSTNFVATFTPEEGLKTDLSVTADEDYYKSGFNFLTYVLGAPANQNCFKVDIYCNFECLPNATFLNYMPISPPAPCVDPVTKRQSIAIIQEKPISKATEDAVTIGKMPSIWEKMKKKFQNSLPSIAKMLAKGIISGIPMLNSGLSLAGSLINDISMKDIS
jgi:hypothetical protein